MHRIFDEPSSCPEIEHLKNGLRLSSTTKILPFILDLSIGQIISIVMSEISEGLPPAITKWMRQSRTMARQEKFLNRSLWSMPGLPQFLQLNSAGKQMIPSKSLQSHGTMITGLLQTTRRRRVNKNLSGGEHIYTHRYYY